MGGNVPVRSVARALDLVFLSRGLPRSLGSLARSTRLSKGTAHRLLATLADAGLVRQDPATATYALGPVCFDLLEAVTRGAGGLDIIAAPILERLNLLTTETIAVYVPAGPERICVAQGPSSEPIRYIARLGMDGPVFDGAVGKVLLAFSDPVDRAEILERFPQVTPAWAAGSREPLQAELDRIRRIGFATSRGIRPTDLAAVGVPIVTPDDQLVAALAVSGPDDRMSDLAVEALIGRLQDAAGLIAERFAAFGGEPVRWADDHIDRDTPQPRVTTISRMGAASPRSEEKELVRSVTRAADIMITLEGGPRSLGRIAQSTGLSKPTAHRLLASLAHRQMVIQDPVTLEYLLGPGCLRIADAIMRGAAGAGAIIKPVLDDLGQRSAETVALYARAGVERICVGWAPGRHAISYSVRVGATDPLLSAAMGKVLLAFSDDAERRALLDSLPLRYAADGTITGRRHLEDELDDIRGRAYAISHDEPAVGVAAISAPIFGPDGRLVAAISIVGPESRLSENALDRLHPMLVRSAADGTNRLRGSLADVAG